MLRLSGSLGVKVKFLLRNRLRPKL